MPVLGWTKYVHSLRLQILVHILKFPKERPILSLIVKLTIPLPASSNKLPQFFIPLWRKLARLENTRVLSKSFFKRVASHLAKLGVSILYVTLKVCDDDRHRALLYCTIDLTSSSPLLYHTHSPVSWRPYGSRPVPLLPRSGTRGEGMGAALDVAQALPTLDTALTYTIE